MSRRKILFDIPWHNYCVYTTYTGLSKSKSVFTSTFKYFSKADNWAVLKGKGITNLPQKLLQLSAWRRIKN